MLSILVLVHNRDTWGNTGSRICPCFKMGGYPCKPGASSHSFIILYRNLKCTETKITLMSGQNEKQNQILKFTPFQLLFPCRCCNDVAVAVIERIISVACTLNICSAWVLRAQYDFCSLSCCTGTHPGGQCWPGGPVFEASALRRLQNTTQPQLRGLHVSPLWSWKGQ